MLVPLALLAVGCGWWLVGLEAGDRCATADAVPLTAVGSHTDFSWLPGHWTCVYRLEDGSRIRQDRVLWDGGGPDEWNDD